MSHFPPNGPPPPYYGYTPAAPPPPAFAYVPAPVMMPMPAYPHQTPLAPPPQLPQEQPTYITNHYYQQPTTLVPEPVQVAEDTQPIIDWVPSNPTSAPSLANRAFVAGKEGWDGSALWAIRAHHGGEFVPGKLAVKHRSAYIPQAGKEVPVHNFEVLCAPAHALRWIPASNGHVPVGALAAGNTHNAEPLYIGRVRHHNSVTPGKVHPSHGCCYVSFSGNEVPYKSYEVLCKITG